MLNAQEVLQLTQGEGYENLLPTVLGESNIDEPSNSILHLAHRASELTLITTKIDAHIGSQVWVVIPSNDIIIATQKPQGLSAQNVLEAVVTGIEPVGDIHMVCTRLDSQLDLNAEITGESLRRLNLQVDSTVYLIIKSGSCILYSH